MDVDIPEFEEKLARLRRNMEKTTPEERRTKYASAFKNFKKDVAHDASEILRTFCLGNMLLDPAYKTDPNAKKEVDDLIDRINAIVAEEKAAGELKRLSDVLFQTYSLDKFLDAAAERLYKRVYYEGYGPYWVSHCRRIEERHSYWNPLIQMYWKEEYMIWIAEDGLSFTSRLPPTMKQIREEEWK
jgi:hypothetical protein